MKCSFCGSEFTEEESARSCGHCALFSGCRLVKCPNCGYESPQTPGLVKRLRAWRERLSGAKQADSSSPHNCPMKLNELRTGARAEVVELLAASAHERGKLMALGVTPGTQITLVQRVPSFVVRIGYTQLALDRETAASIQVQQSPNNPPFCG